MAIVKMKKFHLLALNSHRETLLRNLQVFRNIQFEDVCEEEDFSDQSLGSFKRPKVDEMVAMYDEEISKSNYVIDLVSKYAKTDKGLKALMKGLPNLTFEELEDKVESKDYEHVYSEIRGIGDNLGIINSQIAKKKELIAELEPVSKLDVGFDDMEKLKNFDTMVGAVSGKLVDSFEEGLSKLENTYFEKLGVNKEEYYYFIISAKEDLDQLFELMRYSNFNRMKLNEKGLPADNIARLNDEIEDLKIKEIEMVGKLSSKGQALEDFKLRYEYLQNLRLRSLAEKDFMNTSNVFAITGYCPDFETARLENLVSDVCEGDYTIEFEEVDRDSDSVPIMLKNNRLVRAFESVTSTYALPKYNEIDPTPLYAPIYALFFGMMSADFAYGAVLLVLTTLGLKLCNFTPSMRKNVKFFQLIGISTLIWGFLYGSYFGAAIPGMWRLFDLSQQFMTILVISIIMGGIHLYYGLAIKAYMQIRDGLIVDMIFDVIAWYVALSGIIVFLTGKFGVVGPVATQVGMYAMIIGIVMLLVGGARGAKGIGPKIAAGLYNVYGISSYIGDFVSYSRLMALGMSGGYIAFAVNMIAGMVWGKTILGYVAAIIILVLFHAFNLFLSCLGAYVHALRLIYVEFFGKFYEGGGRAFRFFRKEAKYINLDRQFED